MTENEFTVWSILKRVSEDSYPVEGWQIVYLDNAKPSTMSRNAFRSTLAALSKRGLYRVVDSYAWGAVKMEEGL